MSAQHKAIAARRFKLPELLHVQADPMMTRQQRRSIRTRKRRIAALTGAFLLTCLGMSLTLLPPTYANEAPFDTTTAITRDQLIGSSTVSRSMERTSTGTWELGEDINMDKLTRVDAYNETVAALIDGRDKDSVPADFNPNHDTGDTGNAYAFSECTWWAYVRRHQLGLPAGSYMGNGNQWADTARRLGYWVDNTPRQGDVMVFQSGQAGSSLIYGHVAIVEQVNEDGSITTSECGAAYNGQPFSRTFPANEVGDYQYIHY